MPCGHGVFAGGHRMAVKTERAILAGGCFWGLEDLLRRAKGVVLTRVGYTGDEMPKSDLRKPSWSCRGSRGRLRSGSTELLRPSRALLPDP
jgi:hypothetical protein